MNVLYHGTVTPGLTELRPASKGVAYLTPNRAYALFYIRDREIDWVTCAVRDDHRVWYEEWFPGQLEAIYGGMSGYLYTCAVGAVEQTKERDIWIAREPVDIVGAAFVPDACEEILRCARQGLIEVARYERRDADRMRALRAGLPRHIRESGLLRAETKKAAFYKEHFPINGARLRRNDMYELNQVGEHTYYIDCPAKIGVYDAGDFVYLIDSGNDKDAGRRVKKILDEKGWRLKAILNTHSHADHIGGNRYLQQQTGCAVFARGIEADFARHPLLEPSFLYGGCPPKELRHKFLLAQESDASDAALPAELEAIPLPGHSFDMVGYRTPDDVVFLADCLSSAATLEKYGLPFIYDVGAYLSTLDAVAEMKARLFIPAHADAAADVSALARLNRDKLLQAADVVAEACQEPATFEEVLKFVFNRYGLSMSFEQYVLVGSTVRSLLAWMKGEGRLIASFAQNRMLWAIEN